MKIPLLAILFSTLAFPQVPALQSAVPLPSPKVQLLDASGRPCAGCYLWTYAAGTSTPQATYTDSTAGTPNANPVVLDAGGFANVWIGAQSYKLVLERPPFVAGHGSVVWTVDNVTDTTFFYLTYLRSISDSALLTYIAPYTDAVTRNVRDKLSNYVDVKDFGAECDGVTDDTDAFVAALAAGGLIEVPNGTCVITSMLSLDISRSALRGRGTSIIDASGVLSGAAIEVYSTAAYGQEAGTKIWPNAIQGLTFLGDATGSLVGAYVGKAGSSYQQSHEISFTDVGFYSFNRGIQFRDNAWRFHCTRCGMENIRSHFVHFDHLTNAGEAMTFDHCWTVNGIYDASWYLNYGQWYLNHLSFPGGGNAGMLYVAGAAHVTCSGCSLETQPQSTDHVIAWVRENADLTINNSTILINESTYDVPYFQADDGGKLELNSNVLPLYDYLSTENTNTIRSLVKGDSARVYLRGNVVYGGGLTDATKWGVVAAAANPLHNAGVELGNLDGWVQTGTGTAAAAAGGKNGTYAIKLDALSTQAVQLEQRTPVSEVSGRLAVLGFWAKAASGSGADLSYPQLRFYDQNGNFISNYAGVAITSSMSSWTWLGESAIIPKGTASIGVMVTAEMIASGVSVYYDDMTLNIL